MGLKQSQRHLLLEQLRDAAKQILQLKRSATTVDPATKAEVYEKIDRVLERESELRHKMRMLDYSRNFWADLKHNVANSWTGFVGRIHDMTGRPRQIHRL